MDNFTTRASLVGFLLTLAALNIPAAEATAPIAPSPLLTTSSASIEARLARLSNVLQERNAQLDPAAQLDDPTQEVAIGWGDGRRGTWVNGRRVGWQDGRRGNWVNVNPWRNGWSDRGGFFNYRW